MCKSQLRGGKNIEEEACRETAGQKSRTSPCQVPGGFFANAGVGSGDDDCFPIEPLLRWPVVTAHTPEQDTALSQHTVQFPLRPVYLFMQIS